MLENLSIWHYSHKSYQKSLWSENVSSADNQQERLDYSWIVGFVDGEGCFHIGINMMAKMSLGWQVLPEFRIVQHEKDEEVLYQIRDVFGFGTVTKNHGNRKELRIRGLKNLNKVVSFFKKNQLKTTKRHDFELFANAIYLMNMSEHLKKSGLKKIAELASKMNRKVTRKYLESSETIRQTYS